jgi:hydroxymethylglutaryl-CoA lyase
MKIIECPRDAMQGIESFIPTSDKVKYINQLLKVGFDTIDFGSFVSPKAIPQMRDTAEVLGLLDLQNSETKLLAIVANGRGAREASSFESITYLGFPLSISETFQQRNANMSIARALTTLEEIKNLCVKKNKKMVTYISMGFGNPYGDPYDINLVGSFVDILLTLGSDIISLADTIGVADPESIENLFSSLSVRYPSVEIGAHLHTTPDAAVEKIHAALRAGCKRFDGAIRGYGGCPMAKDDLVGNLSTETILQTVEQKDFKTNVDHSEFHQALKMADKIFPALQRGH